MPATTLDVPLEQSSVTDDSQRLSGAMLGDLLIVTDPNSEYQCRFVPDPDETQTLLLLDECPDCTDPVPITQVATLADLSAYLDAEHPGYDPSDGCPEQFHTDPAHHPYCGLFTGPRRPPGPADLIRPPIAALLRTLLRPVPVLGLWAAHPGRCPPTAAQRARCMACWPQTVTPRATIPPMGRERREKNIRHPPGREQIAHVGEPHRKSLEVGQLCRRKPNLTSRAGTLGSLPADAGWHVSATDAVWLCGE